MIVEEMDVVAAIIRQGEKILVSRRMEGAFRGGLWEFPGGRVEKGESKEEALAREIEEELGVRISVGNLYFADEHVYDVGEKKRTVHLFFHLCEILSGEPACLGVDEFAWILPEELPFYAFVEGDLAVVKKIVETGFP